MADEKVEQAILSISNLLWRVAVYVDRLMVTVYQSTLPVAEALALGRALGEAVNRQQQARMERMRMPFNPFVRPAAPPAANANEDGVPKCTHGVPLMSEQPCNDCHALNTRS